MPAPLVYVCARGGGDSETPRSCPLQHWRDGFTAANRHCRKQGVPPHLGPVEVGVSIKVHTSQHGSNHSRKHRGQCEPGLGAIHRWSNSTAGDQWSQGGGGSGSGGQQRSLGDPFACRKAAAPRVCNDIRQLLAHLAARVPPCTFGFGGRRLIKHHEQAACRDFTIL